MLLFLAQVSFSDQNLSVVRRRRFCCRKLFTQASLGKGKMKGPALFQGEIMTK